MQLIVFEMGGVNLQLVLVIDTHGSGLTIFKCGLIYDPWYPVGLSTNVQLVINLATRKRLIEKLVLFLELVSTALSFSVSQATNPT